MRNYRPRHHYGAPLEEDGILHGAGQSDSAFARYAFECAPDVPRVVMLYLSIKGFRPENRQRLMTKIRETINIVPWPVIPQIGLSMAHDGHPERHYDGEVARGEYDAEIALFWEVMVEIGKPFFLRLGYEFNGRWNGYQAPEFREAYRRVAAARGSVPAALTWCAAAEGLGVWEGFYPGDDVVDWWGIDLFDREHFSLPQVEAFMAAAHRQGKPVMIGETTSRYVGVLDGLRSWEDWYAPFFDFMAEHPGCKLFSYINWDWAGRSAGGESDWSEWGNARIECNPSVLARWKSELAYPIFNHGSYPET
ncbi:MAG: hypothetical protein ACLFU4_01895 [Opitutales bacterium]